MAADLYNNVKDVESTAETSTIKGARSASQILQAADGKDSTALDSTVETSTSAPRSAEQIMAQMKEEEKSKTKQTASSVKSSIKSEADRWKNAGMNVKNTVSEAADAVSDVSDTGKEAVKAADRMAVMSNAVTTGLSALGLSSAGNAVSDIMEKDVAARSAQAQMPAPTDEALAAYQRDISEMQGRDVRVKRLLYTNDQQMKWNAQDQHRMYSNYGHMYEHGSNEMEYNFALLSSAMANAGMPAKTLSTVPTLKQKVLAAVHSDDDQMDINSMSFDRIMNGEVDLLHVDQKRGTEDLHEVNGSRDVSVTDRFASVDHGLDARDAEKKDIARSFAEAANVNTKAFTEDLLGRGQRAFMELGIGGMEKGSPEEDLEADFF